MGKMSRPKPPSQTPSIGEQIRDAIGASPDDTIHVTVPQFERTPGTPDPEKAPQSLDEWLALSSLSRDDLTRMGCRLWSTETRLMLFPGEWFDSIPEGLMVETVNGGSFGFTREEHNRDIRFGMLAFGVIHA